MPPAAAIADSTNQSEEEQTMTIHEYLVKAVQEDARRAGERDRLLREARRARRARRQRLVADQLAGECRASPAGGQCLVCLALLDVRHIGSA